MDQAAMDKMFAQLAKSARIDVFKTSLDSMQEALEVSRKIREDEKKSLSSKQRGTAEDARGICLWP